MLNWQGCRNVTENEKKAINTALEELNFSGKTTEEIQELINNDVIVLSDCRSGKTCIWYLDGDGFDCAVYVDNCEVLTEEQEQKELLQKKGGAQVAPFCRSWRVVVGSIPVGRLSDL